jgi:predicted secreted hydrolase
MAHFAVLEEADGSGFLSRSRNGAGFSAFERFSRAALGLAAGVQPFRVWLEDWTCESISGDSALFPLRLKASQGSVSIDLVLGQGKGMVLQGDSGFSRKGPEAGNASYYYSYTRMPTEGRIKTGSGDFKVTGNSWMDREWGSSILTAGTAGWEWFGLQLADSTDLLFFRLRPSDEGGDGRGPVAFDYGMLVDAQGKGHVLKKDEMRAEILSLWKSPAGRTYPARWRIGIPSRHLTLEIAPKLSDQELDLSIPYWEGAVGIKAERDGKPLGGEGYMELTGYR